MAKRGGFPGGAMPGNMNNLMKQAQRMQRQMEEGQKELETKEFSASAGGGAVEVTINGKKEITSIKLAEEIVIPRISRLCRMLSWQQPTKHCARRMKPMQNLWAK